MTNWVSGWTIIVKGGHNQQKQWQRDYNISSKAIENRISQEILHIRELSRKENKCIYTNQKQNENI